MYRCDKMRNNCAEYSEMEAAQELGISVARLRTMIRTHVHVGKTHLRKTLAFQRSDLLIFRFWSGQLSGAADGDQPDSARIEQIARAYSTGTYNVDAQKVAAKIIERTIAQA